MSDKDLTVKVIKEGYLGKKMKHNILRKVQKRYFKLLDYELLYWKKKEDADAGQEPLAYIPLKVGLQKKYNKLFAFSSLPFCTRQKADQGLLM